MCWFTTEFLKSDKRTQIARCTMIMGLLFINQLIIQDPKVIAI